MKLLIVVDKLLTGFDAPSATYLYIDKSMRDHDLFRLFVASIDQMANKDYGYIVDYMDLFRNLQLAISDYTSEHSMGLTKRMSKGLLKTAMMKQSQKWKVHFIIGSII